MKCSSSDDKSPEMGSLIIPRILIADQSVAVIERLAALIADVAHVVGRATNAHDAISGIRSSNPHLTVFDVGIAHGIDLLRQIKRHQPPVITVILTHSADETTRHYCLRLGAEYFLDKLSEFDKVREIVIAVGSGWGRGAIGGPLHNTEPH
jgi:DNA-binding NarL/FixJ family response regulator